MKTHCFRLSPKADLKKEILRIAGEEKIAAGCIVTCVGSLEKLHLRYAHQDQGVVQSGFFEIVSLVGTFSESYGHFHVCVSDSNGNTLGGHLLDGNIIFTTAELVIGEMTDIIFTREKDSTSGYSELVVRSREGKK